MAPLREPLPPRVLIVSDAASMRFGGEAVAPVHYFRHLRSRGIETWLVVHERTRDELLALFPADTHRIHFVRDTPLHRWLVRLGGLLPHRVDYALFGLLSRLLTQARQRPIIRKLVRRFGIQIVHQPNPLAPREPSLIYDVGAPVVIGPLNGNMRYPPAFKPAGGRLEAVVSTVARRLSDTANYLLPGKRRCATLLVANPRTRQGLPSGVTGRVASLIDNSVDLTVWNSTARRNDATPGRFIYVGRLVDWKAVDVLIEAFARAFDGAPSAELHLVGDGPEKNKLQELAKARGLSGRVVFHGFQPQARCAQLMQQADVFVLSSLYECGGAVVLEAMACGLPVIATAWGGPADYLDPSCGLLVPPTSPDRFITDFATAMRQLASDPRLRQTMGDAARAKVARHFDWQAKVDATLDVYRETIERVRTASPR